MKRARGRASAPPAMTTQIPPSPTLEQTLLAAGDRHGLVALDLGARWTLVTWATGSARVTGPDWARSARALLRPDAPPPPRAPGPRLPFTGGLVGWLSYEAGASVERMPAPRGPAPVAPIGLWRADGGLYLDRRAGAWRVAGAPEFQEQARALLAAAADTPPSPAATRADEGWVGAPREATREAYEAGVRAVLEHIRAGDAYQVNLAWEQRGVPVADPLRVWLRLREANPARRGAFLRWRDTTLISNSPELYLRVRRRGDRLVATSAPIKGTSDARQGEASRAQLEASEKERAELTMIVDLVRNDLSRVAARAGVRAGPRQILRCGDLWHAEQRVTAVLRRDSDALDAIAASFPPGSVTGAPKVEAMKIIGALEPGPRGVYTGAIGFLADSGEAHLNVAIRTATVVGGEARFHVGAGLVADSKPELEWAETLAKGRALMRWLTAD